MPDSEKVLPSAVEEVETILEKPDSVLPEGEDTQYHSLTEGLIAAVQARDTHVVNALLRAQCINPDALLRAQCINPDAILDEDGNTLLILVTKNNDQNTVQALLQIGFANPDLKNKKGHTALRIAVLKGYADIVSTLLAEGADPDVLDKDGATALMLAAQQGKEAIVNLFLDWKQRVDLNLKFKSGYTALMFAAHKGHASIVQNLLNAGADLGCQDPKGRSAMILAAQEGHADVINFLMERFKKIEPAQQKKILKKPKWADIVILLATVKGDIQTLNTLLKMKRPGQSDELTFTMLDPFCIATVYAYHDCDQKAVMKCFEKAHIKKIGINYSTLIGFLSGVPETPISVKMLKILISAGIACEPSRGEDPVLVVMRASKVQYMKVLLAAGADPSFRSDCQGTALMIAAKKGHMDAVKALVAKLSVEALNYQDNAGYSALMWAALYKHVEIVRFLMGKGSHDHYVCYRKMAPMITVRDERGDKVHLFDDNMHAFLLRSSWKIIDDQRSIDFYVRDTKAVQAFLIEECPALEGCEALSTSAGCEKLLLDSFLPGFRDLVTAICKITQFKPEHACIVRLQDQRDPQAKLGVYAFQHRMELVVDGSPEGKLRLSFNLMVPVNRLHYHVGDRAYGFYRAVMLSHEGQYAYLDKPDQVRMTRFRSLPQLEPDPQPEPEAGVQVQQDDDDWDILFNKPVLMALVCKRLFEGLDIFGQIKMRAMLSGISKKWNHYFAFFSNGFMLAAEAHQQGCDGALSSTRLLSSKPEPQPEPEPEPQLQAEPEPQSEPASEPQLQAEPEPQSEPASEPQLQAEPEPQSEPASDGHERDSALGSDILATQRAAARRVARLQQLSKSVAAPDQASPHC